MTEGRGTDGAAGARGTGGAARAFLAFAGPSGPAGRVRVVSGGGRVAIAAAESRRR